MVFSVILATTSLLMAVAGFGDQYWPNAVINEKLRSKLTGIYLKIEDNTSSMPVNEIVAYLVLVITFVTWSAIVIAAIWFEYYQYRLGSGIHGTWHRLYAISLLLDVPKFLIFALTAAIMMVVTPIVLLFGAYGAVRLLMILLLDAATRPQQSPVAFAIAVIGVASAMANLCVEIAKAFV